MLCKFSQAQIWKPFPVWGGGEVIDVIIDPVDSNILYAATKIAGVYKSTDGGNSWVSIMKSIHHKYFEHFYIRGFAVNPLNNNVLYAVCGQAPWSNPNKAHFFRSNDGGLNWNKLDVPFSVSSTSHSCGGKNTLLIHPTDTAILFCGAQMQYDFNLNEWTNLGGVFQSSDGGATWNIIQSGIEKMWVSGLSFSPSDNNIIYISGERYVINGDTSSNLGLFKYSINTQILSSLFSKPIMDFDFDAGNTGVMIILSENRIYFSTDNGASWSSYVYPNGNWVNFYIKAHPTESGHWYIGSYNWTISKLIETLNYGATWQVTTYSTGANKSKLNYPYSDICNYKPRMIAYPNAFTISKSGNSAFLCDNFGIWKSNNTDITLCNEGEEYNNANWKWDYVSKGLTITEGRRIVSHPSGRLFFCGTYTPLFYSDDNGITTQHVILSDLQTTQISDVAFSSISPNTLYAGGSRYYNGDGKLYKSIDGGNNWTQFAIDYFSISGNNINNVTDMAVSPYSSDTIVVGVSTVGNQLSVHISTNGGLNWQPWSEGLSSNQIFQIWQRDKRLYNDGTGLFYFIYNDKLYSRKTSESQWQLTNLPQQGGLSQITIKSNEPGALYLARYNNKIYKTINRGADWTEINTSPSTCNRHIAVSPANLMAVINCEDNNNDVPQRLYVSFDQGNSFTEISLDGITGMVRGITFIGSYTLAAWSENSGYYYLDLNLVSNASPNSKTINYFPNPVEAGNNIFLKNYDGAIYRVISVDGRVVNSGVIHSYIIAPERFGTYIIEIIKDSEMQREILVVTE